MHLASGEPVDREEVAGWMASEDARRFMTLSSDRWSDANVEAGEDAGHARAAAERTTAAYTGA